MAAATPTSLQSRDDTSSVEKALSILEVLAASENGTAGVSSIAAALRIPKSTAHRILKILVRQEFVDRSRAEYRVGTRLCGLGYSAHWSVYGEMFYVAEPVVNDLFERLRATVHLAVLDGTDVLYLDKVCASGGAGIPSRVGGRLAPTCTALGKALLAFSLPATAGQVCAHPLERMTRYSVTDHRRLFADLEGTRAAGLAFDREEAKLGVHCVAAPILDAQGLAVAAVSASGPTAQLDLQVASRHVRTAARAVEQRLLRVQLG